jgi:hypothetical protein
MRGLEARGVEGIFRTEQIFTVIYEVPHLALPEIS